MKKSILCKRTLFTLAAFCLAVMTPVHAVSLYKWVDENGRVHYSQTPPEKSATQSEQMHVKDRNPYVQEQPEKNNEDSAAPKATEQEAIVVNTRKRNCEVARKNLEAYRSSDRVKQPDGTVITLSDEMRASKIKEMQAQINAYCN